MPKYARCRYLAGHGVASGKTPDPRFPLGTLQMQAPFILKGGLDLSLYHSGTLNLSLLCASIKFLKPDFFFSQVKWSEDLPAENFSFYPCALRKNNSSCWVNGFIYWPHPSTKPEFHHPPKTYEILAPTMPDLQLGELMDLRPSGQSFEIAFLES